MVDETRKIGRRSERRPLDGRAILAGYGSEGAPLVNRDIRGGRNGVRGEQRRKQNHHCGFQERGFQEHGRPPVNA